MTTRERRQVFGEVADDYDRVRPGYPAQLVDDVLAAAGPGPVLEVGAGTGKATVAFAARGADLTCIEPDQRMAEVLRRNVPGVQVVVQPFEEWRPDRGYGLLVSAQAWHWVDTERRPELAWAALAPGGLFAPFWNVYLVTDPTLHAALAEVDARHGLSDGTSHRFLARDLPAPRSFEEDWHELGLTGDRFDAMTSRRYHSALSYPSAVYRDLLLSTSIYRIQEPAVAEAALDETIAVIDAHGGVIDFEICTDVALARRH
jgi:trans-aconitate methyltransferase